MSWATGFGFNFRSLDAAVIDGLNEARIGSRGSIGPTYPGTVLGQTVGWEQTDNGTQGINDNTLDRRVAGWVSYSNAADASRPGVFRVDLPAAGAYRVRLAAGSNGSNFPGVVSIVDDDTVLLSRNHNSTTSSVLYDAAGNVMPQEDWASTNASVDLTFASTICRVRIGGTGVNGATRIRHLFLQQLSTPTKGARVRLYSGSAPVGAMTGIRALWWDTPEPAGAPAFETLAAATDADGYLTLDLDGETALDFDDPGFLALYKLDATDHRDSLAWQGRVLVEDIG